jgi:hypothetical protein
MRYFITPLALLFILLYVQPPPGNQLPLEEIFTIFSFLIGSLVPGFIAKPYFFHRIYGINIRTGLVAWFLMLFFELFVGWGLILTPLQLSINHRIGPTRVSLALGLIASQLTISLIDSSILVRKLPQDSKKLLLFGNMIAVNFACWLPWGVVFISD